MMTIHILLEPAGLRRKWKCRPILGVILKQIKKYNFKGLNYNSYTEATYNTAYCATTTMTKCPFCDITQLYGHRYFFLMQVVNIGVHVMFSPIFEHSILKEGF